MEGVVAFNPNIFIPVSIKWLSEKVAPGSENINCKLRQNWTCVVIKP